MGKRTDTHSFVVDDSFHIIFGRKPSLGHEEIEITCCCTKSGMLLFALKYIMIMICISFPISEMAMRPLGARAVLKCKEGVQAVCELQVFTVMTVLAPDLRVSFMSA